MRQHVGAIVNNINFFNSLITVPESYICNLTYRETRNTFSNYIISNKYAYLNVAIIPLNSLGYPSIFFFVETSDESLSVRHEEVYTDNPIV